jgi:hypothetical protein
MSPWLILNPWATPEGEKKKVAKHIEYLPSQTPKVKIVE